MDVYSWQQQRANSRIRERFFIVLFLKLNPNRYEREEAAWKAAKVSGQTPGVNGWFNGWIGWWVNA